MAATMFNRAKQMATENIGGVKTEFDDELKQLFQNMKLTKEFSDRFIRKAEEMIQPNPALRAENIFNDAFDIKKPETMTTTESMGCALEDGSNSLPSEAKYTESLKLYGLAERHLGGAQRKFAKEVQDRYLAPFKLFMTNEVADAMREKKNLETKRLDLDVAKAKTTKAKKPAEIEAAKKELDTAQEDYTRQADYIKVVMGKAIASHRAHHLEWLGEFQQAQTDHFKECNVVMEELAQALANLASPPAQAPEAS
jgi:endophilin-B